MDSSKKSVLIIEDETNIQKAIEYNLTRSGYNVYIADDGEQGLVLFNKQRINLLILFLGLFMFYLNVQ